MEHSILPTHATYSVKGEAVLDLVEISHPDIVSLRFVKGPSIDEIYQRSEYTKERSAGPVEDTKDFLERINNYYLQCLDRRVIPFYRLNISISPDGRKRIYESAVFSLAKNACNRKTYPFVSREGDILTTLLLPVYRNPNELGVISLDARDMSLQELIRLNNKRAREYSLDKVIRSALQKGYLLYDAFLGFLPMPCGDIMIAWPLPQNIISLDYDSGKIELTRMTFLEEKQALKKCSDKQTERIIKRMLTRKPELEMQIVRWAKSAVKDCERKEKILQKVSQ